MSLRHLEIILPSDQAEALKTLLGELAIADIWHESVDDGLSIVRLLLEAERTGAVVDAVAGRFGQVQGFRLLMTAPEAALPRPEEAAVDAPVEAPAQPVTRSGLSREELHHDIEAMTRLSVVFVVTVVLSMIVATVGMVRDNVAVIIGAMVIAPLLGPNVGLAFAVTLGDVDLLKRAVRANVAGFAISLGLAVLAGLVPDLGIGSDEVLRRTEVALSDVVLALAAGAAGSLAVTTGVPAALVGVMVAVALLPPTVALGLMVGSGSWPEAGGAALLLLTNVICINLSGVVTFLAQGVQPLTWWEADRARRFARRAVVLWVAALALLVLVILVAQGR